MNKGKKVNKWSKEEIEELKLVYKKYPLKFSQELLVRHKTGGCNSKAYTLGLTKGIRNSGVSLKHLSETDRAYIAAFMDGEGSICLDIVKRKVNPRLSFANTHLGVIQWLQKKCTVGNINIVVREKINPKWHTLYQFQISGVNNVYDVLKAMMPYLIIKKDRAKAAMDFLEKKYNLKP